jgi:hypothetical protein
MEAITGRFMSKISDLPPLGQLRVLRAHEVDDLAAVLTKGTNLHWLEVTGARGIPLSP